ncbi:MAG: hypothetical protein AABZ53_01705 [Planctomycetota bacterium]
MARVYLETSFVSACVSDRQDTASLYRREVSNRWWAEQRHRHELVISDEVVFELSHPDYPHSAKALALVESIPFLDIDEEATGVAKVFVRERVMPQPARGDALHIAVCCVRAVDCVLSWNVQHLANPAKVDHLRRICARLGLVPPVIVTPDNYFWEDT